MKDYYQILSVPGNATQAEIRKSYYKLAKQYHPDKNTDTAHHHKFLDINEAYQILGDKNKREIYHYRWVTYKNQSRQTTAAAHTHAPGKQAQATSARHQQATYRKPQPPPPVFQQRYQNYAGPSYREYEPALRRVCQLVLLLSFLFIADKFLAHRLENEIVTGIKLPKTTGSNETPVYVNTKHTHFRISMEEFQVLAPMPGEKLSLRRTPFFNQVTHINFGDEEFQINKGTVYHNFFLLLLLQAVAAGAGLYHRFRWQARMNAGIIAGCFGAITLILILANY